MDTNHVILVDNQDQVVGYMEKLEAHQKAALHRAVSVFIINSKGEWLLQQRAKDKYHSNSLWTNTCCTHPYPGERVLEAANRRLEEEMGMHAHLQQVFHFTYLAPLDNQLTEHELDHVFVGFTDQTPIPNSSEVKNYAYKTPQWVLNDITNNPDKYTEWFKKVANDVYTHIKQLTLTQNRVVV